MTSGRFDLYVKPPRRSWGLLESFEFDDSKKKGEQREAVLEHAQMSRALWQANYHAFSDALFCLEERANGSKPLHLQGAKREHAGGTRVRKIPSWLKKGNHNVQDFKANSG